ncbi:MAG: siphovirus Gp157 family protein [bacterium]
MPITERQLEGGGQIMATAHKSMFGILSDMDALIALLENEELSDEESVAIARQWWAENTEAFNTKADHWAFYIKELKARAKARKEKAQEIADLAAHDIADARWYADTLQQILEERGIVKLETANHSLGIVRAGGKQAVEIDSFFNITDAPAEFVRTKYEWNKEAILEALEKGAELPFAHLGERATRLSIK